MRVQVKSVQWMPGDTAIWLVKRARGWVLYVTEEILRGLGGWLPGCAPVVIRPRWIAPRSA